MAVSKRFKREARREIERLKSEGRMSEAEAHPMLREAQSILQLLKQAEARINKLEPKLKADPQVKQSAIFRRAPQRAGEGIRHVEDAIDRIGSLVFILKG